MCDKEELTDATMKVLQGQITKGKQMCVLPSTLIANQELGGEAIW